MDYFEKAHTQKSVSRGSSKAEQNMKNQLKQMLHGYKKSDNELIKNSDKVYRDIADAHAALDESSSVSGFSDLDITMSEEEDDIHAKTSLETHNNIASSCSSSCSNTYLSSNNNSGKKSVSLHKSHTDIPLENIDEDTDDCLYPIIEADEDIEQLSTDEDEEISSLSDLSIFDSIEASPYSFTTDTASEEFDADGALAMKIIKKLEEHQLYPPNVKRKCTEKERQNLKNERKKSPKKRNIHIEKTKNIENGLCFQEPVQLKAEDMPDQSLSDILGDYKYPTVRHFRNAEENINANDCSIFLLDDESKIEEDADSLIPEIGDDPVIEDIEIDLEATDSINTSFVDNPDISSTTLSISREESFDERMKNLEKSLQIYYKNKNCIIVLKHPTQLYLNGKIKLKPLGGTLEIFGYILKKEVCVYGPNNSFAYCVKTVATNNDYFGLFSKLSSAGLSVRDAENIVTTLGEYDCVISLSSLVNPRINFIDEHFSMDLFHRLKLDNSAFRLVEPSNKIDGNIYLSKPLRSFHVHLEWEEAITCGLKEHSRGIICGGKGVGKSTFLRYHVNRMLDTGPVLVIDLDPGQAEFTVAGCISATIVDEALLGPNYTHLKTAEISYSLGMISTLDNTFRYTAAISKLINYCHSRYRSMPWIVNTMGMTMTIGMKFLLLAIIQIQPTFLIQIDSDAPKKRFECYLEPEEIKILYENYRRDRMFRGILLPEDLDYNFVLTKEVERHKQHTSLAPKDNRYLNFLAYFGGLMNIHKCSFLGVVPYRLNLSELNIVTNVKMEKNDILKVINGKIVALCHLDTHVKGSIFTLDNTAPVCYGHGLIRGVDFENDAVYLVTPEPVVRLSSVNALLYSDWTPELQDIEQQLPPGTAVPYRTALTDNQHMRAPQRRFNPLKLLKMTRNA